ncbi:MAG: phosphodiester glycosidase family protein [bacterium]|nr:phosphodiester glycosidase family protein [bacterium]
MNYLKISLFIIIGIFLVLPLSAKAVVGIDSSWTPRTIETQVGAFAINQVEINLSNPSLTIKSLTSVSGERLNVAGPVIPMSQYINDNGAFAAINGSYFCPADYWSCNGIAGSFYWMWYDTNSGDFANAYQNQFNQGPVIAFDGNNGVHYFRTGEDWPGKEEFQTREGVGLQAVISNGPGLIFEGQFVVSEGQLDDKQRTVKSNRSGIGFLGDNVYLVVASGATVMDLGYIMQAMDMEYAMNLDGGGSSTLYYDGSFKVGPGRELPNTIVFIDQAVYVDPVVTAKSFFAYDSRLRSGFKIAGGNVMGDEAEEIIVGTAEGSGPQVMVTDSDGTVKAQFFAYDSTLRNGVTVTACDVNGDGLEEIVTAQDRGGWPLVRIFDGYGNVINDGFLVLDGKFIGGVNLSCGDIQGDGISEIVVAAMRGGGPQVMVYNLAGNAYANFYAYDAGFRGGINVTTIDMDGDGKDEIVTGPQFGSPHIQIFQIRTNNIHRLSPGFMAFNPDYRGGVDVGGVDIDGDGIKELIVGVGEGATSFVKIYNIYEENRHEFFAFPSGYLGGVQVSGGDVDNDGVEEILVVPRSNGGPQVRIIEPSDI